jgi:hypothetical protein
MDFPIHEGSGGDPLVLRMIYQVFAVKAYGNRITAESAVCNAMHDNFQYLRRLTNLEEEDRPMLFWRREMRMDYEEAIEEDITEPSDEEGEESILISLKRPEGLKLHARFVIPNLSFSQHREAPLFQFSGSTVKVLS